jgi:putative endonuclease
MGLTGEEAEERACRYLQSNGYRIVSRNWRSRFGEIDIVARDGDVLVFVEVKARADDRFGGPAAAVDLRKQVRLATTARQFMDATQCDLAARFDVVTFVGEIVEVHRDAFQVD